MAKTKVELQNYQGESLSPITIASNVLYEDGRNAQEVFEEYSNEAFTPTIENSSSMFKVGQGDNVDYSSNVVNGAYESMVLKGKTMVNCIQEPSSQDVVLPYEFADGQYVTINDTKESGALGVELKGQTLVNIHKLITPRLGAADNDWYGNLTRASGEISFDVLSTPTGWRYIDAGFLNFKMLKPNTKYLVVFESSQNLSSIGFKRGDGLSGIAQGVRVENNKAIITTDSQIVVNEQILYVNFYAEPNTKVSFKNPMIIEYQQGMENWNIPYFTGMTSCKMPILRTVGKNLFNINGYSTKNQYASINGNTITVNAPTTFSNTVYTLTGLKEGELYRVSLDKTGAGEFSIRDTNGTSLLYVENEEGHVSRTFTYKKGATLRMGNRQIVNSELSFANIQIEHGSTETVYESYKSSILSLPEEVVLRSLPNGVCDTFNTRTGVYTQRIGEVVLDGSHSTRTVDSVVNSELYQPYIVSGLSNVKNIKETAITVNCDKLITRSARTTSYPAFTDNSIAQYVDSSAAFVGVLLKSTLGNLTPQQWFESNPVRVQYELETPVITKINLSSTLKSWNTTTHIYSEIPENTLYPILTHSNPSYPVILKPSTKYSIVANSYSNNHTNSTINFNLGGATASTTVGNRVTTITTPSTLSNELLTMSGRGNKLNNVMVIEGDVVGDEPYFEGICDCKSPILSNVGKNLLPTELSRSFKHITGNQVVSSIDLTSFLNRGVQYVIKLAIPKNVKIAKHYSSNSADDESVLVSHGAINSNNTIARFTIPSNSNSYYLFVNESGQSSSDYISDISELVTIELDTGNIPTEIKPYKSNITTFDQKDDKTIVLRSLPNGVCDTLNVETGEYVQRIGEVVLDGSEEWSYVELNNTFRTSIVADKAVQQNDTTLIYVISDKYTSKSYAVSWNEGKFISLHTNKQIVFRDENFPTLVAFKQWLSQNPTTVQYELATPIVSTIDVQGFPYAYTNGHVQLSSGSIEQSLTPKVEYSVATNRNGQIRSNQKMVEKHQQHLDQLQAMIISNMVNTQYQQTLTTLNYDLLKKEVGE